MNTRSNPVMSKTRVVHIHTSRFDVFIGRPSKWGNPFQIGVHGTRDEVIELYKDWIHKQKHLMRAIKTELKGRTLGCFCAPNACHGDILAEIADEA